jgi:hypothetical protein
MHVKECLLIGFMAGLVSSSQAAPPPALQAWFVDSLIKVFPDDPPQSNVLSLPEIVMARRGHASVQVALRSDAAVGGVSVTVKLGGFTTQVRHVGFVPVGSSPKETPPDELLRPAPGLFPDPLFEQFPFDLPAGQTKALWLTIRSGGVATRGIQRGEVTIRSGSSSIATLKFTVRVTPALIPEKQMLKVTNWLELEPAHLEPHYQMKGDETRYWQLLENIGGLMAEHRQNVLITPVFSLATPSVRDDVIVYDFSRLDRWVRTFEKAGVIGTIEGGHLLGRVSGYQTPIVVPAYVIEDGKAVVKRLPPDDPRAEQFFNSFLPALHAHLKSRKWAGRYIQHIHDEPHGDEAPVYERYARLARRNLPGIPTIDAVSLDQDSKFFEGVCDVWVPVLGSFDRQLGKIRSHVERGGQAWFYTCIHPQGRHLNRFIDLSLLKVRLLHWFNYRHGLTGFLHWGGNYWHEKPFENVQPIINDGTTLLPAGDNAIVYPYPEKNTVLSSIRLEAMREGIEDYELLVELGRTSREKADELARTAIPNIDDYVRSVAEFRRLQRRLLDSFGDGKSPWSGPLRGEDGTGCRVPRFPCTPGETSADEFGKTGACSRSSAV